MPEQCAFEYAVIRIVPRVEREEFVNAGVVLYCAELDFLAARIELDEHRLRALSPEVELSFVREHLQAVVRVCVGGVEAGAIGQLPTSERFRWLVAPRSTILQTSATHGGLCQNPEASLEWLIERQVRAPLTNRSPGHPEERIEMESKSDLKRQYKETANQAGIFLITNTTNGKVFLGSSLNLHGPLNKHRFMLSIGSHLNSALQADWRRSGPEAFTFEIVEIIEPSEEPGFRIDTALAEREEAWLAKTQPVGERGYNKNNRIRE